jgi:hypothetical protein
VSDVYEFIDAEYATSPVPLQNVVTGSDLRVRGAAYAARWYSLITPPSTFRRCTGASSGTTIGSS